MQNTSNSLDMYSPPLSSLRVPSFAPVTFSAQALNCLNAAKVSDFCFRRCFEVREVINEGDPVAIPLMCGHLDKAMYIAVDELEGL